MTTKLRPIFSILLPNDSADPSFVGDGSCELGQSWCGGCPVRSMRSPANHHTLHPTMNPDHASARRAIRELSEGAVCATLFRTVRHLVEHRVHHPTTAVARTVTEQLLKSTGLVEARVSRRSRLVR